MFDPLMLMRLWTDSVLRMTQAAAAGAPAWLPWGAAPGPATPADVPRQLRNAMLDAWGQWWDRFLRSPEFLETMKGSLEASTQWRKQLNEWLGNVHHQLQGVSRQDLDAVMSELQHVEERLMDAVQSATRDLTARCEETAAQVRQLRAGIEGRRGRPEVPKSRRPPPRGKRR
jgi:gas vesicle protein